MTGMDLAIYILENRLENDDVKSILNKLFVPDTKYAASINCGVATVRELVKMGKIDGLTIHDKFYIYSTNERGECHD